MGPSADLLDGACAAKWGGVLPLTKAYRRYAATGTALENLTTPITVYIVDDDDGVRRALARVFRSVGFQCHQFASTSDLLVKPIETTHACIISDLNIAGDDPTELPARLKSRSLDLPVVFISADATDANRAKVRTVGGFGLFHKPVDSQALIDAIQWAIEGQEN